MKKEDLNEALRRSIENDLEFVPKSNDEIDHEFSDEFNEKIERLIKRQKRSRRFGSSSRLKRGAIVFVSMVIVFVSVFCVKAARETIFELAKNIFESFVEYPNEYEQKETIEREYIITKMPDGFEISGDVRRNANVYSVEYVNSEGDTINYSQITNISNSFVNNEGMEYHQIDINDSAVDIYTKKGTVISIWMYDGYYFQLILCGDFILEDAVDIIRSIK